MTSPTATVAVAIDSEAHALVRRVAIGDALAFETLYQQYTPRLMAYLLPRLGYGDMAEEVCQDVWMVVWNRASRFQAQSQFSTWLIGIAQRLVWKARTRRINQAHEALPPLDAATEPENPEVHLSHQDDHNQMAQAVAMLPPVLHQTLTLHYDQGLTYNEIAARMSCSASTVKMRLQQSRRRLSVALRRAERTLLTAA